MFMRVNSTVRTHWRADRWLASADPAHRRLRPERFPEAEGRQYAEAGRHFVNRVMGPLSKGQHCGITKRRSRNFPNVW